ncbi:MAG TPA: DUF4434 domain-containing protein [Verrucomicrobiota bacterium]|nr:DUF4434 domain-containing protein [Verrucomicrobiota bacterium]HQB15816.1 DUF4434 domain-containing protein [Verrucomicrobiota bacterium]
MTLMHCRGTNWPETLARIVVFLRCGGLALPLVLIGGCVHRPTHQSAHLIGCLWYVTPAKQTQAFDLDAEELDAIKALRMHVVVLMGSAFGATTTETSDPSEALFQAADQRRMELYVSTGSMREWWTQPDATAELARARERIQSLHRRYGRHPSFKGFYVPYETYVMWGAQRELARTLYREVAAACKAIAPTKPVMISPFFILDETQVLGDFRWATPADYTEFWIDILHDSAIDIVALQDRGEHLAYYTDAQCAPFFAAMKQACDVTGKQLWANVETGELLVDSPADYVARFGLKTHVNDPRTRPYWRGVPVEKLAAKLRFVRAYTPTAITWGYREFIRPAVSRTNHLYQDYQRLLVPETLCGKTTR